MLIITWGEFLSIWRFKFTQSFCKWLMSKSVVTGFGDFDACSVWDSLPYTQYSNSSYLFLHFLCLCYHTGTLITVYMTLCKHRWARAGLFCSVKSNDLSSPQSPFTASGLKTGWKRHRLHLASSQTKQLEHKTSRTQTPCHPLTQIISLIPRFRWIHPSFRLVHLQCIKLTLLLLVWILNKLK